MKLTERLMTTSELDSKITAAIVEAMKAGVTAGQVQAVLDRIKGLVDEEVES